MIAVAHVIEETGEEDAGGDEGVSIVRTVIASGVAIVLDAFAVETERALGVIVCGHCERVVVDVVKVVLVAFCGEVLQMKS